MTVWWITLASSYLLCLIARSTGKIVYQNGRYTEKCNKVIAFFAMMVLILVAGLRNGIGDTVIYMDGFKTAPSTIAASIKMFVNKEMKDRGFYLLEGIIKSVKDDKHFFIFVMSFVTIGLIFMTYYKYSEYLELSIYLFITTGCYLVTMNGIRQYLASAILFFFFPMIENRNWKAYIPIVLICSTLHKSALIFLPLYFLANHQAWGKVTKWILMIGIILYVTYPVTGPILADMLGESQYGEYKSALMSTGSGANMIRVLVMAVPVVLSYIGREYLKGKEKYYNIIVNFSVVNLIFILLATKFWIYARFNMYFSVYMIILIIWCIRYLFDETNRKIIYILCMFFYFIYYWYEMVMSLGQTYIGLFF